MPEPESHCFCAGPSAGGIARSRDVGCRTCRRRCARCRLGEGGHRQGPPRRRADAGECVLNPRNVVAYLLRGASHERKGDHGRAVEDAGRAIQELDQAIRLQPTNASTFVLRGYAYEIRGDYDRAIQEYDQAIRLDSKNAVAYSVMTAPRLGRMKLQHPPPFLSLTGRGGRRRKRPRVGGDYVSCERG